MGGGSWRRGTAMVCGYLSKYDSESRARVRSIDVAEADASGADR